MSVRFSRRPKVDLSRFETRLTAVDTHTEGEFTRIVVDGLPPIPGDSMIAKRNYIAQNLDHLRRALLFEPRGHQNCFGALLTEPVHPEADLGVIFMESETYTNMCVHAIFGVATAAVEAALVPVSEPVTYITLDTCAGLIHSAVQVENGRAVQVTVRNVPCYLALEDLSMDVRGWHVPFDIAFGGQFIPLVNVKRLGIELKRENIPLLTGIGCEMLRRITAGEVEVQHPLMDIHEVTTLEFYDATPTTGGAVMRNIVVFGHEQVDRSPSGTCVCAKMALLHARGRMKAGGSLVTEGILGTRHTGRIVEETTVGPYQAVVPEITGNAYVTGVAEYLIDPHDPLKYGFMLS